MVPNHLINYLLTHQYFLLVELKAVSALEDIFFAIGRSQMKAMGIRDGLILNFATMPLTIKRIGPGSLVS